MAELEHFQKRAEQHQKRTEQDQQALHAFAMQFGRQSFEACIRNRMSLQQSLRPLHSSISRANELFHGGCTLRYIQVVKKASPETQAALLGRVFRSWCGIATQEFELIRLREEEHTNIVNLLNARCPNVILGEAEPRASSTSKSPIPESSMPKSPMLATWTTQTDDVVQSYLTARAMRTSLTALKGKALDLVQQRRNIQAAG